MENITVSISINNKMVVINPLTIIDIFPTPVYNNIINPVLNAIFDEFNSVIYARSKIIQFEQRTFIQGWL